MHIGDSANLWGGEIGNKTNIIVMDNHSKKCEKIAVWLLKGFCFQFNRITQIL